MRHTKKQRRSFGGPLEFIKNRLSSSKSSLRKEKLRNLGDKIGGKIGGYSRAVGPKYARVRDMLRPVERDTVISHTTSDLYSRPSMGLDNVRRSAQNLTLLVELSEFYEREYLNRTEQDEYGYENPITDYEALPESHLRALYKMGITNHHDYEMFKYNLGDGLDSEYFFPYVLEEIKKTIEQTPNLAEELVNGKYTKVIKYINNCIDRVKVCYTKYSKTDSDLYFNYSAVTGTPIRRSSETESDYYDQISRDNYFMCGYATIEELKYAAASLYTIAQYMPIFNDNVYDMFETMDYTEKTRAKFSRFGKKKPRRRITVSKSTSIKKKTKK
jgi:hypothetical protein